jgi:glycosyltransferase involved in cell wall biosynthesis
VPHATVAACLIVKDGVSTVGRAIESVRPHVDEVCCFDTGSTDGTLELLARLAARPGAPIAVEQGEWRDDFAWAREQSFAMARSEWLLWIDADDELEGGHLLRGLLRRVDRVADGVAMQYVYDVARDGTMGVAANRRIVRRGAYRWAGWCHEELVEVDRASTREVIVNPYALRMVHRRLYWQRSDGSHLERNVRILRREVTHPDARPEAWWNLGKSTIGVERLHAYERYLELIADRRFANPRLGILRELGRADEADAERAAWVEASRAGQLSGIDETDPDAIVAADALFGATVHRVVERNDRCWCSSGRKAKACCGAGRVPAPLAVVAKRGGAFGV